MAAKRKLNETTKKTAQSKNTSGKSTADNVEQKQKELSERRKEELIKEERSRRRKCSILLFAIGVLLVLFTVIGLISGKGAEGNLLDIIYSFLCGVFGFTVFFTGPIIIYVAVLLAADKSRTSILTKILQLSG